MCIYMYNMYVCLCVYIYTHIYLHTNGLNAFKILNVQYSTYWDPRI